MELLNPATKDSDSLLVQNLKSIYNKRKSFHPDQHVNTTSAKLTPVEEVQVGSSNRYQTDTQGLAVQHNDIISSCISHGDLKTFKQLFQTKHDDILSNCGTAGDGNYLATALKRTDNVNIAKFLLSQEKLLRQLLYPTSEQKQLSYTTLLTIAEFGHYKLAKKLIKEGEKGNSRVTIFGWIEATISCTFEMRGVMSIYDLNCIQIAAMKGRSQIIDLLTDYLPEYMFDIQYNEGGFSPLILASRFGNCHTVGKLRYLSNIDFNSCPGKLTALHFAACYNHDHVVGMLLQYGADAKISSGGCLGHPLVFAAALGHIEVVDTFLRCKAGTSLFEATECSLHAAAAGGHNNVITKLLNYRLYALKDKDVQNIEATREIHDSDSERTRRETENSEGSETASSHEESTTSDEESTSRTVHFADDRRRRKNKKKLQRFHSQPEVLVEHIFGKRLRNGRENSSGSGAASSDEESQPKTLRFDDQRRRMRRPGSPSKHTDKVDITSIDVDCLDEYGNTPLLIASYAGHVSTVELLLSRGASVQHRNNMGHGVWVMLCLPKNVDNARHQLSVFKRQPGFVKDRSFRKTQRVLTGIREIGIDIFKPDSEGYNFMHLAAQQNLHRVLKHFLPSHSMLTTTKAASGDTPLLLAMRKNNNKSVMALLRCPHSLKIADKKGKTALHLAAESKNQKAVRMIIGVIERDSVPSELNVSRPASSDRIELDNSCDLSEVPMMQCRLGRTALHYAAMKGHLDIVKYLLRFPDCMTIVSELGYTPLHEAAETGSCSVVRAMIELIQQSLEGDGQASSEFSRDPTSVIYLRTSFGHTPMHLAACSDSADTVEILLKYPKTLTTTAARYSTPLHMAVRSGNTQVVDTIARFIQHKDNIAKFGKVFDAKDECTPVHAAIKIGNVDMVRSLLQFPEALAIQDTYGCSAMVSAAQSHSNVLEVIINHLHNHDNEVVDIASEVDKYGRTLLHVAASSGSIAATTVLLRHYPEMLFRMSKRQQTVLHEAVDVMGMRREHTLKIVECIVDAVRLTSNAKTCECDEVEKFVMMKDDSGETALHLAAKLEDSDVLAFLLHFTRKSWMATEKSGRTILHASQGRPKTVQLIVEFMETSLENRKTQTVDTDTYHANENNLVCMRDNDGKTVLHLVCESRILDRELSAISYLVKRHPECLLVEDNQGRSPLHAAASSSCSWDDADGVCAVLDAIKTSEYLNKNSIGIPDDEYERWILWMKDSNGHTALHLAVDHGNTDTVRKLLADPATVTIANNYGVTPLHSACTRGDVEIVQILFSAMTLESRLEMIFLQDHDGNTPLHSAVLYNRKDVVRKLLQLRCPDCIAVKNKRGYNALHVAAENGNADILRHLLKIALDSESKSLIDQLVKCCCVKGTPLHLAIMKEHILCIELLVKHKVTAALRVKHDGMLPLHFAAMSPNPEVLKAYLSTDWTGGFDIFDSHGWTALMYCTRKGDVEGFELLAGRGANVAFKNDERCNLLHYTIEQYRKRSITKTKVFELYKYLIKMSFEKNLNLQDDSGMCRIAYRRFKGEATPVQLAAAIGAVDICKDLLFRDGIGLLKLEDATVYNLKYVVPSALYMQNKTNESEKSCIELIAENCRDDEIWETMEIPHFRLFLTEFSRIRTISYYILFFLHIIYMSCFSAYVLPTCYNKTSTEHNQHLPAVNHAYGGFVVWPAMIVMFEMLCCIKYAMNLWFSKSWSNDVHFEKEIRKKAIKVKENITSGDKTHDPSNWKLHLSVLKRRFLEQLTGNSLTSLLEWFQLFSHISSLGFSCLAIACCSMYFTSRTPTRTYVDLVAATLIFGWLHAIEYVKGFPGIHAFAMMLKIIFVQDIRRILFIYAFVLIGFSTAVYGYTMVETSWSDSRTTFSNTAYQMFGAVMTMGNLFDMSSQDDEKFKVCNPNVIRLMFAAYFCITVVVLMNILIAMMNSTYTSVIKLQEKLWCYESLHFVTWISRDNLFGIRTICRALSHRFVYNRVDEKIKERVGIQLGDSTPVIFESTQLVDNDKTIRLRLETATEDISRMLKTIVNSANNTPTEPNRREIVVENTEFLNEDKKWSQRVRDMNDDDGDDEDG